MHKLAMSMIAVLLLATPAAGSASGVPVLVRTLDGSRNNLRHPDWGKSGTPYSRVSPVDYADGIGEMVAGPPPRYISNRVFDDTGQNLFSEKRSLAVGLGLGSKAPSRSALRPAPARPGSGRSACSP